MAKKAAQSAGKFLLFRFGLPIGWVIATIWVAATQYATVAEYYTAQPLATVLTIVAWLTLGTAFLPLGNRQYRKVSAVLIIAGGAYAAYEAHMAGINLLDQNVLIFGGGAFLGFLVAWMAGAGTVWWRFAQGKFVTHSEDPDTHGGEH